MQICDEMAGGHTGGEVCADGDAGMLNVDDVARMLRCSPRTVYRLADSGRMPSPVKLATVTKKPGTNSSPGLLIKG